MPLRGKLSTVLTKLSDFYAKRECKFREINTYLPTKPCRPFPRYVIPYTTLNCILYETIKNSVFLLKTCVGYQIYFFREIWYTFLLYGRSRTIFIARMVWSIEIKIVFIFLYNKKEVI